MASPSNIVRVNYWVGVCPVCGWTTDNLMDYEQVERDLDGHITEEHRHRPQSGRQEGEA